ncbi:hypothetical protein JZK55_09920 [Dissulfurispira thermophila]|uniref:Glycosyl transferase family 1 domain-containing protein n=2 Tax=Dissulfurispira thermophila TaxID=2715679 RepID=A0A7G1GZZ5_9BACT|nr:hypothetical protein JZK55_09920 [Dissulfurispira thermophila]
MEKQLIFNTEGISMDNFADMDGLRLSLQSTYDKNSLLELLDKVLDMGEIREIPIDILQLLREKIFLIFINKLEFDTKLFRLHKVFNNDLIPYHKGMAHIKDRLLFDYYERVDVVNKEAILMLALLIDILNNDKDRGIKDFIMQCADIFSRSKTFGEIINNLHITAEDIVDIYIESGILSPDIFMKKAINIQKNNLLFLRLIWLLSDAPVCYTRLYDLLKTLLYESIKAKNIELVLYIGFFTRYYYGNLQVDMDAWKRLDEEIEKPMSDFFVRYCRENNILPCSRMPEKGKKIKVGYIYQRLAMSSPVTVLLSLLYGHYLNQNPDFEFYVYSCDYKEKIGDDQGVIDKFIRPMGFKCISAGNLGEFNDYQHSHFEKAMALRRQIIKDEIDIFVTTGTQIGNFLVSSRVAPIQIYWSHGDPYWSVNNLDYRIVHSAEKSVTKGLYGGMEYFKFPNLMSMELLNPNISPEKIEKIRLKFPEDKILLGVFGRLVKLYHPDYLFAVSEILKKNQETVFLICGSGDNEPIKKYFEIAGCIDRVYFEGHVNPNIYGHIIDIALDPFPIPMGVAFLELQAKGKPIVSYKVNLYEINEFRLKDVLASTTGEYIQIAGKLIKDEMFRKEIGEKYRKFVEEKLDCQRAAKELERLYKGLI